jgi:mannose-6-phosphate isomerase-like protein (cupin superfamily)
VASVRRVPKPWGHELVFAENERYAGKILHIEPGHSLSLQYHERKDETLYVLSGEVYLQVEVEGTMRELKLGPGEGHRIRPGERHRLRAEAACEIVEVSSPELDDVVRLEDAYGRAGTTEP